MNEGENWRQKKIKHDKWSKGGNSAHYSVILSNTQQTQTETELYWQQTYERQQNKCNAFVCLCVCVLWYKRKKLRKQNKRFIFVRIIFGNEVQRFSSDSGVFGHFFSLLSLCSIICSPTIIHFSFLPYSLSLASVDSVHWQYFLYSIRLEVGVFGVLAIVTQHAFGHIVCVCALFHPFFGLH